MPYTVLALLSSVVMYRSKIHSGKCRQQSKSHSMVQEGTYAIECDLPF
jgi:hypothetical protein